MRRFSALTLAVLLCAVGTAPAVIMNLTPLSEVLANEDYIFVASLDKVDAEKPLAVFKLEKKLKGEVPFERLAVNMTGNDESKKAGDTKTILDRLDASRKVVFFVSKQGKKYNAMAFVEGSWFSAKGTEDPTDKVVRWAFQSGEPYLRRTFKGTSAEMIQVIEDGLAKKAKPPAPNEKEKPGYGPPVEKKCSQESRVGSRESGVGGQRTRGSSEVGARYVGLNTSTPNSRPPTPGLSLLGVIPSFVLVGPLAVIAALFPGLFAKMAVGMTRWRAFLVVASVNSTLALLYWLVITYWPSILPAGWAFGLKAFTVYLMAITAVGLCWAGRRYRRMAATEPNITNIPTKVELYSLSGLTAFAALAALLTGLFASWGTNLELPLREFTFIGIALAAATGYAGYRYFTQHIDSVEGQAPERRLSLSGESVGLATLLLCGLVTVLNSGASSTTVATGTVTGDADAIGPRLVDVKVFEVKKASQVMSGITVAGDRLYFGSRFIRAQETGQLICLNRETGEQVWRFEAEDMKPVFCTPTVADGRVYCGEGLHGSPECRMFCLNAGNGEPAWELQTQSHTEGTPALLGDKLFFPAGDDGLIAVNAKTGEELWRFAGGKEAGVHIDAAPAVSGNRVFIGSGLYSFVAVCLDADTRKELWRTDLKLRAFGAPLAAGKFVYFGVGSGNMTEDTFHYPEEGGKKDPDEPAGAVVCLEAETGKEVWRYDLPRSVHSGLTADGFSIYACSRDGHVYAIDRKTGKLRWKTGIGGAIMSAPAVSTISGMPIAVYAVSREGLAVCLNPHTGKIAWQKQLPGFQWDGKDANGVFGSPAVVTTTTPMGSKRSVYFGAMTVDPNVGTRTCAVFRFDDEIGGE